MFALLDGVVSSALRLVAKYGGSGAEEELAVLTLEERARRAARVRATRRGLELAQPRECSRVARGWPAIGRWVLWTCAIVAAYSVGHLALFMLGVVDN